MSSPDVCVAHLVRAQNGSAPLEKFLASYEKHRAGMDHELLFILKGFASEKVEGELETLLGRFTHSRVFVGDWGHDITAYFRVVKATPAPRYFCFLNSFSEILADDWLLKLYQAVVARSAGIAGATASKQGFHPDWKSIQDREKISMRANWKNKLLKLPWLEDLNELTNQMFSPEFPNPHIRTNGFLIERALMLALHPKMTLTKRQAYGFESGRQSMTRQILKMNRSVQVVGRDGRVYDMDEWKNSGTFWQADQQNLLIADKQTKRYQAADQRTRKVFSRYAWGKEGDTNALTKKVRTSGKLSG